MENVSEGRTWNYKKIFITLFLLIGLIAGGYYINTYALDNRINPFKKVQGPKPVPPPLVKGIATSEEKTDIQEDIQEAIKEKIEDIKKDVSSLNVVDIASSSPPVQKILNDIKALQEYPANELKSICKQICGL